MLAYNYTIVIDTLHVFMLTNCIRPREQKESHYTEVFGTEIWTTKKLIDVKNGMERRERVLHYEDS